MTQEAMGLLDEFLSYAAPGNYDPAPFFYPEYEPEGDRQMKIREKAAKACLEHLEIEIDWDPSPVPMKNVLISSLDDKRISINGQGYVMQIYYKDITDLRFVDEPREEEAEELKILRGQVEQQGIMLGKLMEENAELERSMGEPVQLETWPDPFVMTRASLLQAKAENRWIKVEFLSGRTHTYAVDHVTDDGVRFDDGSAIALDQIKSVKLLKVVCEPDEPVVVEKYDENTQLFILLHLKDLRRKRKWSDESEAWFDKTIAEFEQSLEPYDIAKERWIEHCDGSIRRIVDYSENKIGLHLFRGDNVSWNQIRFAAAAPELADKMRRCMNAHGTVDTTIPVIKLLRKLGVPNVAPWYEGDE